MPKKLAAAAAAAAMLLVPGAVLAAGSPTSQDQMNAQSTQAISQELKQKLQDQGYSDVKVVPGSLIVSAKDKNGDPVTMVIGPQSMTVFAIAANNGSGAASAASAEEVTGSIQSINPTAKTLTLDNGATYRLESSVNTADLKTGQKVTITYSGSGNDMTASSVQPAS
jgi:FKBP-type peptidyl-prolyl cis-trans isomerase